MRAFLAPFHAAGAALAVAALLLAGCAGRPPTPAEIQDRRFVEQRLLPLLNTQRSDFRLVAAERGRALVMRGEKVPVP